MNSIIIYLKSFLASSLKYSLIYSFLETGALFFLHFSTHGKCLFPAEHQGDARTTMAP